jgi:hypothetical protein
MAASRNDEVTKNFNLNYGSFNPLTLTFDLVLDVKLRGFPQFNVKGKVKSQDKRIKGPIF